MIQRVQTLYLLCATAFVAGCFFFSVAELTGAAGHMEPYTLLGLSTSAASKWLSNIISFLSGIVVGTNFTNIFSYKKRKWQMKICLMNIALLVIIEALIFFLMGQFKQELGVTVAYKLPIAFPLISAVLIYLAFRGIKKDDKLVRSYDRIR